MNKRIMYITIFGILVLIITSIFFLYQPLFGLSPSGERLERMQKSPNYRDGKFHNISPSEVMASDKSRFEIMWDFLFGKVEDKRPDRALPTIKTNIKQLPIEEDLMIWLGHSALYLQMNGKRVLIDPTLINSAPVSFINKAFKGTKIYSPDDFPDIDILLISHDHYDHLDKKTVKKLKDRIGKVICPLGVGEHFEDWGFKEDSIEELYWNENIVIDSTMIIHCLPARHFSGRTLSQNNTLWASFMIETPTRNIYYSGDSGYDSHFSDIGKQFPKIDVAILENGQFNIDWKSIHMMPDGLLQAIKDLNPDRVLTVHNSKYALSRHAWYLPLDNISEAAESNSFNLMTPMIGETIYLNDTSQVFKKWWIDHKNKM